MTKISAFKTFLAGAALTFALPASQAIAHGSMKPQHGGQVALAGDTVIELVRGAKVSPSICRMRTSRSRPRISRAS